MRNEVAAEVAVPGASTGTSPTRAAPMEVSLRPTATAAATLETALLDLDQSAARDEVAAEVAVPGTLGGGTTQVVPTAEEPSPSSHRSPAPAGDSMAPSLRQIETAAVATPGSEQPSLDHLAVHLEELPVALRTVDPTPYIPHPTTDTCSAAAAPALRVETGSGRRGDLASRGIRASTPDMNFDTGVKPVRPPSAFDSAKEGDLSRLASLQPGAERGVTGAKCDAIRDGPKAAAARGCASTERPAGASEGPGVAKACEQYGIHPKPGTGPGCTSAEGPTGAAGEPGVVRHCNLSGIPYESCTDERTPNSSASAPTPCSARASTGQHTHTSHTGIGAGSDDTALPQRPATTAPSATLSSQLSMQRDMANAVVAPPRQLGSADSFPYRRRTLRDLGSATATLPTEQQGWRR